MYAGKIRTALEGLAGDFLEKYRMFGHMECDGWGVLESTIYSKYRLISVHSKRKG
jgi:hypothetical protein